MVSLRRYVSNEHFFRALVESVESKQLHSRMVGGNAHVIARRLALEGADVMLAAKISDK